MITDQIAEEPRSPRRAEPGQPDIAAVRSRRDGPGTTGPHTDQTTAGRGGAGGGRRRLSGRPPRLSRNEVSAMSDAEHSNGPNGAPSGTDTPGAALPR